MATGLKDTPVLLGIGAIIGFATLNQAQGFFAPVLAALVFGVVLSPLADLIARIGFRPALTAFVTVSISLICVAFMASLLEPYVNQAIAQSPSIWQELRETVESLRSMMRGISKIADDVAQTVSPDTTSNTIETPSPAIPTLTDALFLAPQFLAQFMMFIGVLYFFLLSRPEIYAWTGKAISALTSDDFFYAERQVSRYFLTIAGINAAFGVVVGVVMQAFGMPAPVLWGLLAFLLNFVLYLGPILLAVTLLVIGIVTFDGPISFVPAAVDLAINATEGQFITPALVGQKMAVNPLLVFVSLVFWLWLWGPIGGIIAIPLLIWCIAITARARGQAISSGTPGNLRPNRLAGRNA